MSELEDEWLARARESAEADPRDKHFASGEVKDPRVPFTRTVVVGGFVDGRREKPGVLLFSLTSDGEWQELGCSSQSQAAAVIRALLEAWPSLLGDRCLGRENCLGKPVTAFTVGGRSVVPCCQPCANGRGPILAAKILAGQPFDWEAGRLASDRVVNDAGEINYWAAASADPGVTRCPSCGTYHWREGIKRQCAREGCNAVWS